MSGADSSETEAVEDQQAGDDPEIIFNMRAQAEEPDDGDHPEPEPAAEAEPREHGQGDQLMQIEAIKSMSDIMQQQLQVIQQQFFQLQEQARHREEPTDATLRPVARMMTFDGSTPWLEYEAYLDEYARALHWTDVKKAQILCLSLRGAAQGILLSLQPQQREDYTEVTSALRQHFCPAEKVFVYQAELQARRLQEGEDLAELARDIRTKTRLAYPEADTKTLDSLMQQYFVSSLGDKEQRLSVAKSHPRNLTQALAFATEYESIMKAESGKSGEKKKVRQTKNEDVNPSMEEIYKKIEALSTKISKMGVTTGPRRIPRDKSQVQCYACNELGHYARECTKKEEDKNTGAGNA